MSCDVCGANNTVDDEVLADVVSRTSAHLSSVLSKFSDVVSQFHFDDGFAGLIVMRSYASF